jgi:hypothetical protein
MDAAGRKRGMKATKGNDSPSVEYYAISLDEWSEESFNRLGSKQDGGAGHYARFDGTKDECIEKATAVLKELVGEMIYRSDDYGYPAEENHD